MGRGSGALLLAVGAIMLFCCLVGCQTTPAGRAQVEQRLVPLPKVQPANPASPDKRLQPELPRDQPVEELPIEPIPPVLAMR